jgi:hypothetical protein
VRRAELHEVNEELAAEEPVTEGAIAGESEDGVAAPGSKA